MRLAGGGVRARLRAADVGLTTLDVVLFVGALIVVAAAKELFARWRVLLDRFVPRRH